MSLVVVGDLIADTRFEILPGNVAHLDGASREIREIHLAHAAQIIRLHAVEKKIVEPLRSVDEDTVDEAAHVQFTAGIVTTDYPGHGAFGKLVREIHALKFSDVILQDPRLRLPGVLLAPLAKDRHRVILRKIERDQELREIVHLEVLPGHDTLPAEGTLRHRFILREKHLCPAAVACSRAHLKRRRLALHLLELLLAEALLLGDGVACRRGTSAESAVIDLCENIKLDRCTTGAAVYIKKRISCHMTLPFSRAAPVRTPPIFLCGTPSHLLFSDAALIRTTLRRSPLR